MSWFGSQPPSHPPHVAVISRTKLAAHLVFFEWNVDPISCSKDGDGRDEHRPSADPEGNAKREDSEAQIHRIAGVLVRASLRFEGDVGLISVPSRRDSTIAHTGGI